MALLRRRRLLLVSALAALVLGGAGALATTLAAPIKPPPAVQTQFGYIKSLTLEGTQYKLRLNPAFFLVGHAANAAAVAAGELKPGESVPNDYFIVRTPARTVIEYTVAQGTPVTVISNLSRSIRISVRQLAQILERTSPLQKKLIDPGPKFFLGYWLVLEQGKPIAIDQQFQP